MAAPDNWLCDMDGVLINDGRMIDGADRFLDRLRETGRRFLVLTNNSLFTPDELCARLASLGVRVAREQLWTSALATACFVNDQRPGGSAFVIGEASVHEALADIGYFENAVDPDYVVLGEVREYSYEHLTTAIRLIDSGVSFVATNPEVTDVTPLGLSPGCGALAAMIEATTGVAPYFVGKPNAVMIRDALNMLDAHSQTTVMIGDRMDTDIHAGTEAGVQTILVLSGVARREDVARHAYRPTRIVDSVADLIDEL